jgi:hypothetical protein
VIARRISPFPDHPTVAGGQLFDTEAELLSAVYSSRTMLASAVIGQAGYGRIASAGRSVVVPAYLEIVRRAAERAPPFCYRGMSA